MLRLGPTRAIARRASAVRAAIALAVALFGFVQVIAVENGAAGTIVGRRPRGTGGTAGSRPPQGLAGRDRTRARLARAGRRRHRAARPRGPRPAHGVRRVRAGLPRQRRPRHAPADRSRPPRCSRSASRPTSRAPVGISRIPWARRCWWARACWRPGRCARGAAPRRTIQRRAHAPRASSPSTPPTRWRPSRCAPTSSSSSEGRARASSPTAWSRAWRSSPGDPVGDETDVPGARGRLRPLRRAARDGRWECSARAPSACRSGETQDCAPTTRATKPSSIRQPSRSRGARSARCGSR